MRVTDPKRPKDFLSPDEANRLIDAAKKGKNGIRDYAMVMMLYRHGWRVSEAVTARINDVDLKHARLWVNRLKGGLSVEQPMESDELKAIKRYLSSRTDNLPWLFLNDRGVPITRQGVNYLLNELGKAIGLKVHPHMLRHSCGFYLANKGYDLRLIQDYLGHRDPKHTAHYTRTASIRFEGIWGRK